MQQNCISSVWTNYLPVQSDFQTPGNKYWCTQNQQISSLLQLSLQRWGLSLVYRVWWDPKSCMSHRTNRFLSPSASQVLINPLQRHERPWTASFNNLQLSELTLLLKTKRRLHPACFVNPNVSANTFNFRSVIHSFPLIVSSHLHFLYSILLSTSSILSLC